MTMLHIRATRATQRARRYRDRGGPFWDSWIWAQAWDHPQRLMAQPKYRVRQWLRGRTEEDRAMADAWRMAPARAVKMILNGVRMRVVL